jgi:lipopolysaccharide export LptBFGC system permease protein LptF
MDSIVNNFVSSYKNIILAICIAIVVVVIGLFLHSITENAKASTEWEGKYTAQRIVSDQLEAALKAEQDKNKKLEAANAIQKTEIANLKVEDNKLNEVEKANVEVIIKEVPASKVISKESSKALVKIADNFDNSINNLEDL